MNSRHAVTALAALATVSSLAAGARAQEVDEYGIYRERERNTNVESPQHAAFEIRFGRYVPNIDDEFNGATPYETTFGSKDRYIFGLEADWQLLRIPYLGTLGPGLGIGYTHFSAPAFVTGTGARAGENTTLTLVPMYVLGVLRADIIARQTPVPIVPYLKLGLGSAIWRIANGGGTAKVDGIAGSGLSWGPQFALGGMLLLDFFDKDSAKNLDNEVGINNSYFFMEWSASKLGAGNQLEVGTSTWALGLAFEI
ncbi:MAG TPA: MXAN_2562 family outer membrane beta-barrel protein [Polyangiaceae bacterium]|jgi:hypothetical protein|nr:MXAN_2562 family outer membrane beta-barrel protein [Polyangiaceae bacterium]